MNSSTTQEGNSVSQPSARRREGLTKACRRRRTASAPLPLPAAPDAQCSVLRLFMREKKS